MSAEGGRLGKADPEEVDDISPDADDKERLRNAYGGIEIVDDFHVVVEQDGELSAVASGGGVPFPPAIDQVYVVFADGIEFQHYVVELEARLVPSSHESGPSTETVHRLRQEGSSEWDEPWAVEVVFVEQNEWLVPIELRFEGLAKHAKLSYVVERGVEGGRIY